VSGRARKLQRRLARQENGDLSALRPPLDTTYRRLVKKALQSKKTAK
jgi:hypothetical protein